MVMLGDARMKVVPALGLPKTSSLVGRIFIPTISTSPVGDQRDPLTLALHHLVLT